jgi:hypothetical protein
VEPPSGPVAKYIAVKSQVFSFEGYIEFVYLVTIKTVSNDLMEYLNSAKAFSKFHK